MIKEIRESDKLSAKNRGVTSRPFDMYYTPESVIDNFLSHYKLRQGAILECAAGNGAFIRSIRKAGYKNKIYANEIRDSEHSKLIHSGADVVSHKDFINDDINISDNISTIFTNPPYSIAQEFLEKCFNDYPNAEVIMLLRLAFLESVKRQPFWNKYPPNSLYVLSKRPSFTGNNKTDATAYCWIVWNGLCKQEIKFI